MLVIFFGVIKRKQGNLNHCKSILISLQGKVCETRHIMQRGRNPLLEKTMHRERWLKNLDGFFYYLVDV